MKSIATPFIKFIMIVGSLVAFGFGANKNDPQPSKTTPKANSSIQKIIFEQQKIEGKIRRPQLVLIKADQRPNFPPMIMQSFGKTENLADFIDQSVIDEIPNQGPFQFENTKIANFVP